MQSEKPITDDIISAAREGRVKTLKKLINQYGPNWKGRCNLLLVALLRKKLKVAELFLTKGWGFDITKLIIPLHLAASLNVINSKQIIGKILERGADINSAYKGKTPLHVALASKRFDNIEFLLNHGANVNAVCTAGGQKGYTSLHFAAIRGDDNIVDLLLNKGANINAKAKNGITPLHCAIMKYNEIVVRTLLKHGANVDDQNESGNTALYLAVETGHLIIIKDILQYCPSIDIPSNRKTLINAIRRDWTKTAEVLEKYGFTLNHEDANNAELFHNAICLGSLKIVELFLKNGANPNGLDSEGNTPLHTAAHNSSKEVDELLISYGANINAINNNGITVIDNAVKERNLILTKLLLTHGAHVQDSVQLLVAPLHEDFEGFVEAIFPHCNINAILLNTDIEVYAWDPESVILQIITDVFMYISKHELSNYVKALLYHGADVNILYENLYFYNSLRQPPQVGLRLSDWPSYEHQYEELVGILQRHILQLKIANLYVNEQNLKLISQINEQLKDFAKECKEEISKMKNDQIKNSGITVFNILGNNTNRLVKYMKNKNIVEALKLENYKTEYPIYERMIELNFIKAMKRKELVDQANLFFHFVFKYFYEFHKLPHYLTEEILDYLTDEDFQKLMHTSKISSVHSKTNEKECNSGGKNTRKRKRAKKYSENSKTRYNKKKKII